MSKFDRLKEVGITKEIIIINAIMILAGFLAFLNQTLLGPAQPSIMREMGIDAATVQWLTTGYMMINGIMVPVTAFLLDRYTTRKLFFVAVGMFSVGTFVAATATNFTMLMMARVLQAAGAGIFSPMGQVITLLTIPRQYRGTAMGMIGIVFGVAPCVGPVISGIVVDLFNWHMLFYGLLPFTILLVVLSYFYLEDFGSPKDVHLDMPSVVLSTLGFGGLLYSFSTIGSAGFSTTVFVTLAVGIISLFLFVRRQLGMEEPFLKMELVKNRTFAISLILIMLVQAAILMGTILVPIYVQTLRGYSATVSSLLLLPASIVSAVMSPISGRLFDKYGARKIAIPGLTLAVLSTLVISRLDATTPLAVIAFAYCFRMGGLALVNMPLSTWGLNALDNSVISHGTAINNTFLNAAGSLGTAIFITVMAVAASLQPDPAAIASQIHGIGCAFFGGAMTMLLALVITVLFVKDHR